MGSRRRVCDRLVALLVAVAVLVLAFPAHAPPRSTPNGPWTTPQQHVSLEAFASNEELAERLHRIERRAKGRMAVEAIGWSGAGRPIWLAKVGDPASTPVLLVTQQHGDEPHGTEAVLDLLATLAAGGGPARRILDALFVLVLPRANPDGAAIPTRGNADFTAPRNNIGQCPAAGGSNPAGRGTFTARFGDGEVFSYDVNRYHWLDWSRSWQYRCNVDADGKPLFPTNPVPEAVAVLEAHLAYGPIWTLDVHDQGFNVLRADACAADARCREGRYVTGSLLWPTHPDVAPEALAFSKQMAAVMQRRARQLGNVELTRYAGGTFPAIARNAYARLGSERLARGEPGPLGGAVLLEVAGQTGEDPLFSNGQKAIGKLVQGVTKLLTALLEATANGSLPRVDPALADRTIRDVDVPLANPRVLRE